MKYCGKCGMSCREGAKFCPRCGNIIQAAAQAKKKFCGHCGKQVPASAKFCPYCAKSIGGKAVPPKPPKKRRAWIAAMAAVLVVCVGMGGFFAFNSGLIDRLTNPSAKYHTEENGFVSANGEITYASPTDESHLKPVVEGNDDFLYADNELIVQLANPVTEDEARRFARENGAELVGFISTSGTCQWRYPEKYTYEALKGICLKLKADQDYASLMINEHMPSENYYQISTSNVLPDDAVFHDNCFYLAFSGEGLTAEEADHRCQELGGRIAKAGNNEKMHFLFQYVKSQGYNSVNLMRDSTIRNYSAVESESSESGNMDNSAYVCEWVAIENTVGKAIRDSYSFNEGTVIFHYSAGDGTTKEHYFYYNDFMFYSFDEVYRFQPMLARASLCMAMAGFSNNNALAWNDTLNEKDTRRAANILELYYKTGFNNARCYNYNMPLTDTSDKVAYSMATKYIDDDEGGYDTLVAVVIRGGGYGGEWGSNFHVIDDKGKKNHVGFQMPANEILKNLVSYVDNTEVKGNLKLWIMGYSRSAAVANLVAHSINEFGLGGTLISKKNIYTYTFATPAGALSKDINSSYDPNIFNIVSPVDIVPKLAPVAWGYGRYGTTLTLPYDNDNLSLWNSFQDLSGLTHEARARIYPQQKQVIDSFIKAASNDIRLDTYYVIQPEITSITGKILGNEPKPDASTITRVVDSLGIVSVLKDSLSLLVGDVFGGIATAHRAEYYLARLETDNIDTIQGSLENTEAPVTVSPTQRTPSAIVVKQSPIPEITSSTTEMISPVPSLRLSETTKAFDYTALFQAKISELVAKHGVMAGDPQVKANAGDKYYQFLWTGGETEGMLFADIFDYDEDGEPELLTCRNLIKSIGREDDDRYRDNLTLEIYEADGSGCWLADSKVVSPEALSLGIPGTAISIFRYEEGGAPAIGIMCETDSGNDWILAALSYGYSGEALFLNGGTAWGEWPGSYAENEGETGYLSTCLEAISEESALHTSASSDTFEYWKVIASSGWNFADPEVFSAYRNSLSKLGLAVRQGSSLWEQMSDSGRYGGTYDATDPYSEYHIRYRNAADSFTALAGDLTVLGNLTSEYFADAQLYFAKDYLYKDMQEFIAVGNLTGGNYNTAPAQSDSQPVERQPKASADASEQELREKVMKAYKGTGDILAFGYSDYDWDGKHEAFALIGVYDDETWNNAAELWFVNADEAKCLEKDKGYYPYESAVCTEDGYSCFSVSEGNFGSGWKVRMWTVINAQPVLYSESEYAGQSGQVSHTVFIGGNNASAGGNSSTTGANSGNAQGDGTVRIRNSGDQTNIRTGPGLAYDVLGVLQSGVRLTYLEQLSVDDRGVAWYKCDYYGREGWVSEKYTVLE